MAAPQKRMVIPVVLADKETFDIYTKFRMQMYRIHSETKNVSKILISRINPYYMVSPPNLKAIGVRKFINDSSFNNKNPNKNG